MSAFHSHFDKAFLKLVTFTEHPAETTNQTSPICLLKIHDWSKPCINLQCVHCGPSLNLIQDATGCYEDKTNFRCLSCFHFVFNPQPVTLEKEIWSFGRQVMVMRESPFGSYCVALQGQFRAASM